VRRLVYTASLVAASHILSLREGMEGNSEKLEENGRKKEKK
jgi:hypothetical protein